MWASAMQKSLKVTGVIAVGTLVVRLPVAVVGAAICAGALGLAFCALQREAHRVSQQHKLKHLRK